MQNADTRLSAGVFFLWANSFAEPWFPLGVVRGWEGGFTPARRRPRILHGGKPTFPTSNYSELTLGPSQSIRSLLKSLARNESRAVSFIPHVPNYMNLVYLHETHSLVRVP